MNKEERYILMPLSPRTLATGLSTPCIVIRSYEFRQGLKGDEGGDGYDDEEQYQNRDDDQYEIGSAHNYHTLLLNSVSIRR